MLTSFYIPSGDEAKTALLEHFAARLPAVAELLGIGAADVAQMQSDAQMARYILNGHHQMKQNYKQWTAFLHAAYDTGSGSAPLPALPTLPAPVPAEVALGIMPRFKALVARIKAAKNYSESIGHNLGIIGTAKVIDPLSWKPSPEAHMNAGVPVFRWLKGEADSLEIWSDRGANGEFIFHTITTDPRYTDTIPFTTQIRRYKAIYRLKDQQVGQWSDVFSVAVL